ncbi:MAG: stage II sporulation protein R [Thermosediminibacteraceae bacterium]|nr:stage II sporulation protein R [Thermosediminibacteraceae bacterium]
MGFFKKTVIALTVILLLALIAAVIGGSGLAGGRFDGEKRVSGIDVEDLSSKVIRLHIVANGDSPEEQELKLRVRDAVIKTLEKDLSKVNSIEATREYIKTHLKDIEEIARKEVEKSGKDYGVKALFGRFPFPVKTYGFITLPAGEYEALRIIIGKGEGKNWWCILFPPLCFVDITHGVAREEAKIRLSTVLTPEEMVAIDSSKNFKDEEYEPVKDNIHVLEYRPAIKDTQNREDEKPIYYIQSQREKKTNSNNKNEERKPTKEYTLGPKDEPVIENIPNEKYKMSISIEDNIQDAEHHQVVVKFKMVEWLQVAWNRLQQNFKLAFKN